MKIFFYSLFHATINHSRLENSKLDILLNISFYVLSHTVTCGWVNNILFYSYLFSIIDCYHNAVVTVSLKQLQAVLSIVGCNAFIKSYVISYFYKFSKNLVK